MQRETVISERQEGSVPSCKVLSLFDITCLLVLDGRESKDEEGRSGGGGSVVVGGANHGHLSTHLHSFYRYPRQ